MKIVIPMAGRGSRLKDCANENSEWATIKPLIRIKGVPMIKWATASYPFLQQYGGDNKPVKLKDLIFVCLKEHEDEFYISSALKSLYSPEINIILIDKITRGPAETALKAKEFINSDEDVIISDSDHFSSCQQLWDAILKKDSDTAGILPVIKPPDDKPTWSYACSPDNRYVTEVKEKDPELAKRGYGILGAYYFSHGNDFIGEVEKMIEENDMVGESCKPEFYVSQVYNRWLKDDKKIEMALLEKGWVLGTPKQLGYFYETYKGKYPI